MLRSPLPKANQPSTNQQSTGSLSPRRAALWFFVPWLVILLVPALRWQARVQAIGSEYVDENFAPPTTILAFWYYPRNYAPTWRQLQYKARESAAWRLAIDFKAPRHQGDNFIESAEIYRLSGEALQKQPRNSYLLSLRLRAALAFISESSLFTAKVRHSSSGGTPTLASSNLWESYDYYSEQNFSVAAAPKRDDAITKSNPLIDSPRVTKPRKISAMEALNVALAAARGGVIAEPDNAYWPWQESYLLLLSKNADQAEKALIKASQLRKYDDHRYDDLQQTLQVAGARRVLFLEEKIGLMVHQPFRDKVFAHRERLWLSEAQKAERKGDLQRTLTLSAALASIGALQSQNANISEKRSSLLLQCEAWRGWKRIPYHPSGKIKKSVPYRLEELNFIQDWYSGSRPTPLIFARRFAQSASLAGRRDLADAALKQGQQANISAQEVANYYKSASYGVITTNLAPQIRYNSSLIHVLFLKWAAQMTLVQLQFTLLFWGAVNLVLWRRLWFLGRWVARVWRFFSFLWRTRDEPLWNENVPLVTLEKRDGARSFWFVALFVLPATYGVVCWSLTLINWYPEFFYPYFRRSLYVISGTTCYLLYALAPVLISFLWCGGAAMKRYYRLQLPRQWSEGATVIARHAPPSVIPFVLAFMTWSLTVFAALCWLCCVLAYYLPRGSFDFTLPPLWASWLATPTISLFNYAEEWAGFSLFVSLVALAAWLWKWGWQMHLRRRLPALYFGLTWWRQTLCSWLILSSWFYLLLLLMALPARRIADQQFDHWMSLKAVPAATTNAAPEAS